MKVELSVILLGLLVLANVNATEVLQMAFYLQDGCEGDPFVQTTFGFGNQCLNIEGSGSVRYSCNEEEAFTDPNCEGTGVKTTISTECETSGGLVPFSSKYECVDVPDSKIAKLQVGTSCSGGDVAGVINEIFLVLDECTSIGVGDFQISYKYSAGSGGINFVFFSEKNDCTGTSVTETIPIGECTMSATVGAFAGRRRLQGEQAVKFTAAIEGTTLGGNAMSTSAGLFAFVVAVIAAFATVA